MQGQRLMQATSDIFLGWTQGREADRYFYWRQLRDMKGSALVEQMSAGGDDLLRQALRVDPGPGARPVRVTRSRSRPTSASDDAFDGRSPTSRERYAEQNDRDFAAFTDAIRSSRIEATEGV